MTLRSDHDHALASCYVKATVHMMDTSPGEEKETPGNTKGSTMIRITDNAGTSGTVICETQEAADAIRHWYPEAPIEVLLAIDCLQDHLNRHESTYGDETYLGITIDHI